MKRIQRRDFEPLGWNEANIGWMVYLVLLAAPILWLVISQS
jgi:hypothetical protein